MAQTVILAAGSVPRAIPGVELGGRVLGTEEAWALSELPASLAVVGAGASGAEIASAFARLGSEVLLLEALERVLPSEDADISRLVERGLKRQGIDVRTNAPIESVKASDSGVSFTYGSDSAEVDYLVIATGRGPDVQALGLDRAGVALDERDLVAVNGAMRTTSPGSTRSAISSPGPALAHKASDEGIIAVEDSAGRPPTHSPTSTSPARPSAPPTSAPSA